MDSTVAREKVVRRFHCACGKFYTRKDSLKRHKIQHKGARSSLERWKCSTCGRCYCREDILKRHVRNKHEPIEQKDDPSLRCLKCSRKFQVPKDLEQHEVSHNVESLPRFDEFTSVLPDGAYVYDYLSLSFTESGFIAKFEILGFRIDDIDTWLKNFQKKNFVTLRVARFRKPLSQSSTVLLYRSYRCHRGSTRRQITAKPAKRFSKNTFCPAFLSLRLRKAQREPTKLRVFLRHTHNHPLDDASLVSSRKSSRKVKERLTEVSPVNGHKELELELFELIGGSEPQQAVVVEECVVAYDDDSVADLESFVTGASDSLSSLPAFSPLAPSPPVPPLSQKLQSILAEIFEKVDSQPEVYSSSIAAAEERLSNIHSQSEIVSLFYNMGKPQESLQ